MADEKKAPYGGIVHVLIGKRRKKPQAQAIPERRYGPPPFPDESRRRKKRGIAEFVFIDQQSAFSRTDQFRLPPKQELKYVHKWNSTPLEFPEGGFLSLGKDADVRRYSDATNFVTYREAWDKHPLPYQFAADYGVTFRLGGQTKALSPANSEWKAYSPYDLQEDLLERQADGEDVTAELELNAYEIEEWEAAFREDKTYWVEFLRDHHREWGFYRKRLSKKSTYAIDSSGPCFEPFDPFDTDNYKVTEGDFDDEEVDAPRLLTRTNYDVRFGLIPRRWRYEASWTTWFYQQLFVSPFAAIWQSDFTVNGETSAVTLPHHQPHADEEDPPGLAPNEFGYVTSEYSAGIGSTVNYTDNVATTTGLPSPSDEMYKFLKLAMLGPDTEGLFSQDEFDFANIPNSRYPFERSDATISIFEKDRDVGELVGMIAVNAQGYNVFRKTPASRGGSVYAGDFDTPFLGFGYPISNPIFDNYLNPAWQSLGRSYAYYDPDGDFLHL